MNTIISRSPVSVKYIKWHISPSGGSIPEYSFTINGGAGVTGGTGFASGIPDKKVSLFTPEGVATLVDDDTLDKLMAIPNFRYDIKMGVIRVIKGKSITDQEKIDNEAEKKMADKDDIPGRQMTKGDMEDVGAKEQDDGSWDVSKADTREAREVRKTGGRRKKGQ